MSSEPIRSGPLDPQVAIGLLQRAQQMADGGDWEHAAMTFARVIGSNDPDLHVAALLGLAECRYRMDDEPGALQSWIAATQAPEGPLTWRAWKALAAARVRQGDLAGATRAYREAERRAPANERPEIASRLGWLSKEQGDTRGAERYFRRTRPDSFRGPVVTIVLALSMGLVWALELFAPTIGKPLADLLMLDKVAVYFGEYWRLLTVVLVHGGILHLAFNAYALWIIGPIVEALYGPRRFIVIYLVCALGGSAASYAVSVVPSVGASGAIFGLFGALLVADRVHKPALTRNARNLTMQIGGLIAVNLVIGLTMGSFDNAAHIGGLIAGCWLGLVIVPTGATTLRSFWQGADRAGADRKRLLVGLGGIATAIAIPVGMVLAGLPGWLFGGPF